MFIKLRSGLRIQLQDIRSYKAVDSFDPLNGGSLNFENPVTRSSIIIDVLDHKSGQILQLNEYYDFMHDRDNAVARLDSLLHTEHLVYLTL